MSRRVCVFSDTFVEDGSDDREDHRKVWRECVKRINIEGGRGRHGDLVDGD